MSDYLELSEQEWRAMAEEAIGFIASYYSGIANRPVMIPETAARIRARLAEPLPESGTEFRELLRTLRDVIAQYSRHSAHPRMFGYISSPGTPLTALGSLLTSALNINVTAWRSAPAGATVEHLVIDWMKEMLGYPGDAVGLLTSGGSMANFAALAAARSAKAPVDVVQEGMGAVRQRMCVYVSEEAHFSVTKAAGMLGLGESNVRRVKTDERLRIDMADLARLVDADNAAGYLPFCLVGSAGTTASGAFDPIIELAEFARAHNLWLHIDAAYGGFAALATTARHFFAGIEAADSVALDPHKWLYAPVGCGCVLYKDPRTARAAFSHAADYIRTIGLERDEAFAFWDYGPELTRPFRALDLWLLMKFAGTKRLGQAIENNIACAKYFEELVNGSSDFEMLAPVELSVFCFRYKPAGFTGDLNSFNERTLVELNRAGSTYLSNATIRGEFALRGCVLNYRTKKTDMERVLTDVRSAAAKFLC